MKGGKDRGPRNKDIQDGLGGGAEREKDKFLPSLGDRKGVRCR